MSPSAVVSCFKQQRQFGRGGNSDSKALAEILALPGRKIG